MHSQLSSPSFQLAFHGFSLGFSPSSRLAPTGLKGRGASQVLRDHQHRRRLGGEVGEVGVGDVLEAPEDAADHLPHVLPPETTGDRMDGGWDGMGWETTGDQWRMGWDGGYALKNGI